MRSLEQRIAEINRRSEEILKKRKMGRKRLLAACVPVALGISLAFAVGMPEKATDDGVAPGTPESLVCGTPESIVEDVSCAYVRMEILGDGLAKVYMEQDRIISVAECLQEYTCKFSELQDAAGVEETAAMDKYQTATGTRGETNYSASQGYTVILESAEGDSFAYFLAGNVLYEGDGQRSYQLTQEQAEQLRNLLGI